MNYHAIKYDDMLNGDGLRAVLFVSGCEHKCPGCHNPQTWDCNSGNEFTQDTLDEILEYLNRDYVEGLTLSGGDPLHPNNREMVLTICETIKDKYPDKNIWLYTGYLYEDLITKSVEDNTLGSIIKLIDVMVDGKFIKELLDNSYPWAGSTNQRVIRLK